MIFRLYHCRVCPQCGRSYNVASIVNGEFNLPPLLPKHGDLCDDCNKELVQRSDDVREVIENRLTVYEKQTAPLLDYFGPNGKSGFPDSL